MTPKLLARHIKIDKWGTKAYVTGDGRVFKRVLGSAHDVVQVGKPCWLIHHLGLHHGEVWRYELYEVIIDCWDAELPELPRTWYRKGRFLVYEDPNFRLPVLANVIQSR
jgi:hypothetical protein